mmetsp:Transcript_13894/g.28439  ORF Transcript_13894/g.28439 Transcript_13894/m.28439 type:complete len:352 (-) Transcript_13894:1557-2612(-)
MAAHDRNASPIRSSLNLSKDLIVAFHRTPSLPKPPVSCSARSKRPAVKACSAESRFFSASVSSAWFWRASTLSTTALSSACLVASFEFASARIPFISASFAFFGPTSFATLEYTSMACTHRHRPVAALDTFDTTSTFMFSSCKFFWIFFKISGVMLSLSYDFSLSKKFESASTTFLAVSQSGFCPSMMHTPSITVCTAGGGFAKLFTSVMSPFVKLFKALTALLNAGMAKSRSFCASVATAPTSAACAATTASSADTRSFTTSASAFSTATWASKLSASMVFCTSTGASLVKSAFKESTIASVSVSFCTPTSMRSFFTSTSFCSPASLLVYRPIRSKYDFGVVYTMRRSSS